MDRWRGSRLLAAWLTAVVAIAGPTWRPEPSPFADDPVPVMLVLYAGESMNLADLAPSRMERARLKIADFAAERKGQPLGLIAYSGSAHLVLPPTRDTSVVAAMAAEIGPDVMPRPGNDLAAALRLAARTLGESGGSIVVLADAAPSGNELVWREFRNETSWPVHFLAVARADTPEWDTLEGRGSCVAGEHHAADARLGGCAESGAAHRESCPWQSRRQPKAPSGQRPAGGWCRCWPCCLWSRSGVCAMRMPSTLRHAATPLDDPALEDA